MPSAKLTNTGRPAFAITKPILKKVEKLGASGVAQRWAALALGISEDTFMRRRQESAAFAAAWAKGRAILAMKVVEAAPKVMQGLLKNAITPTDSSPGGNVSAQLGYLEKVVRRPDVSEEIQGYVDPEDILGKGAQAAPLEEGGITEIQEVRVRRIRRIPSGRIEDDE